MQPTATSKDQGRKREAGREMRTKNKASRGASSAGGRRKSGPPLWEKPMTCFIASYHVKKKELHAIETRNESRGDIAYQMIVSITSWYIANVRSKETFFDRVILLLCWGWAQS